MSSSANVVPRLSAMMFLEFFIWGAWYVTVGNFIDHVPWVSGPELADLRTEIVYWVYTVGPIAAVISPLFLGVIADRFFPTQRVLAVLHLAGGAIMLAVPAFAGPDADPAGFVLVLGVYMLCYMPTLGLTNTLAFHHLTDQEKQFPIVRVLGTLGWIAANYVVSGWLHADTTSTQFVVTGAASVAMGVYCLTLPHTPPPLRGQRVRIGALFGIDALSLLRQPAFFVFIAASFLICIPLAAYYSWAPVFAKAVGYQDPAADVMVYGQWTEVAFMMLMPLFFVRLGVKWMLAAGMAAWAVRYGLFAGAADEHVQWMVLAGVALHGICYDFFFVTGQIYVDKVAPPSIRGQAQGFLVLVTQGFGLGIGSLLIGQLVGAHTTGPETRDWQTIWIYPAVGAAAILLAFVLLFRDRRPTAPAGAAAARAGVTAS